MSRQLSTDECITGLAADCANATTATVVKMDTPATTKSLRVIMPRISAAKRNEVKNRNPINSV
jgi:hypothetical protein